MTDHVTHEHLLAAAQDTLAACLKVKGEVRSYRTEDNLAHERIDASLERINVILHGKNGVDGGFVRDMAVIKVTLRAGVWLVAIIGAATITALVGIFFRLAEMHS